MIIGTGTTVSIGGAGVAEILDVTPPGMSRESIPASHMGTTKAHEFLPAKLYDGGELGLDIAFDPSFSLPFTNTEAVEVIITFPSSTPVTWTFDAFVTGYEPSDPLEDRMTASLTLKVTGDVSI